MFQARQEHHSSIRMLHMAATVLQDLKKKNNNNNPSGVAVLRQYRWADKKETFLKNSILRN